MNTIKNYITIHLELRVILTQTGGKIQYVSDPLHRYT